MSYYEYSVLLSDYSSYFYLFFLIIFWLPIFDFCLHFMGVIMMRFPSRNCSSPNCYFYSSKVLDSSVCQVISSAIIRLCNSSDPDTLEKRKDIVKGKNFIGILVLIINTLDVVDVHVYLYKTYITSYWLRHTLSRDHEMSISSICVISQLMLGA